MALVTLPHVIYLHKVLDVCFPQSVDITVSCHEPLAVFDNLGTSRRCNAGEDNEVFKTTAAIFCPSCRKMVLE